MIRLAAHYDARLRLNMVLDEIGSPGQGREHVCKLLLQPGYIGELGGREVISPRGQSGGKWDKELAWRPRGNGN